MECSLGQSANINSFSPLFPFTKKKGRFVFLKTKAETFPQIINQNLLLATNKNDKICREIILLTFFKTKAACC